MRLVYGELEVTEESANNHAWRFTVFPGVGLASLTVGAGKWGKLNKQNKPYADSVIRTISEWG